ncbi:MAG: ParB/RepB/Spo0J family partition protein [Acidobacteria bacterium]|nr:MAG: ParB/RepB/Spo0J family partition protein [Acidobacteriota bacterium]
MAEKRPALGRGLSALIPDAAPPAPRPAAPSPDRPTELDIDLLVPNSEQPRAAIDDLKLEELAQSIRANGVIQPVIVRKAHTSIGAAGPTRYEIIAGERRWRAAQRAGLLKVPVVVSDVPDDKLLEVALIENIQRENLNPIEEAQAYRRLADHHRLSQDEIATAVGKDRATVANYMRLLKLPDEVRNDLVSGSLTMGHARAILGLTNEAAQRRVARETVAKGLSVRETEAMVRKEADPKPAAPEPPRVDPNTRAAEEQLRLTLGTRVRIVRKGKSGRIEIDFVSEDELQRLYEQLTSRGIN